MERQYNGKTKITQNIFDCVKMLQKGGATIEETADYLKIGKSTVSRIRQAESYEDYKSAAKLAFYNYNRGMEKQAQKMFEEERKKQEELEKRKEADKTPEAKAEAQKQDRTAELYQQNRLLEEMKKMNESLKLISNKLAFIVEQLA